MRPPRPDPAQLCQDCGEAPCGCDRLAPSRGIGLALVAMGVFIALILLAFWASAQQQNLDLTQAFIGGLS